MKLSEYYVDKIYPVKNPTTINYWLYVISSEFTGLTKIGITKDLDNRMSQLECQSGLILQLDAAVLLEAGVCEQAQDAERAIHSYYKDKRGRGEWFSLTAKDKEDINNLFYTIDGIELYIRKEYEITNE